MPNPPVPPIPAETDPASPGAGLFREGMSRVAGAVHIVTTDGPAGRAGFTATAVVPVSDTPPSLLVCINAAGRSADLLVRNGIFCINTLSIDDRALADAFAGRPASPLQERFAAGAWERLVTGAPFLATSLAAFDCRIADVRRVATHHVAVGEVVGVRLGEARPALVYRGRAYHAL